MSQVKGGGRYRYRYFGLRLLIFRNGRWFLLPAGWRGDRPAPAVILEDRETLRVELRPGRPGSS